MLCEAVKPNGERRKISTAKQSVPADRSLELMSVSAHELEGAILHITLNGTDRNHFALKPYKSYAFEDSKISLKINGTSLTLSAEKPAYYVSLEADVAGHFSDSAFDLLPGEAKTINFTADDVSTKPTFTIRDLYSATCC